MDISDKRQSHRSRRPPNRYMFESSSLPPVMENAGSYVHPVHGGRDALFNSLGSVSFSIGHKTPSVNSAASSSSAIRRKQTEIKTAKELSQIEKTKEDIEKLIQLKELEVIDIKDDLQTKNGTLALIGENDTEFKQAAMEEIQALESKMKALQSALKRDKINAEFELKELKRKQDILEKEGVLETLIIDAEDDQNLSSDEEDGINKNQKYYGHGQREVEEDEIKLQHESIYLQQQLDEEKRYAETQLQQEKLAAERRLVAWRAEVEQAEEDVRNLNSQVDHEKYRKRSLWQPDRIPDPLKPEIAKFNRSQPYSENTHFFSKQSINTDLPYFDGNPQEWPVFISQYRMTTELCGLSDTVNIQRLERSLKGKAKERVQALLVLPENVDEIISLLERRFGKPKTIIENLLNQVKALQPVKEDQFGVFLDFVDTVRNLTTTAKSLKCQSYVSSSQLLEECVKKLPTSYKILWARFLSRSQLMFPTLIDLSSWLDEESDVIDNIYSPTYHSEENKKDIRKEDRFQHQGRNQRQGEKMLIASENAEVTSQENKKQASCYLCNNQTHRVYQCEDFKKMNVDERSKWVGSKRLCYNCLNFGHQVKDCRSKIKCQQEGCGKSHHTLLHRNQIKAESQHLQNKENSHQQEARIETRPAHINLFRENIRRKYSILQVVPVTLQGPKGSIKTHALLDGGSAFTVIKTEIAQLLGLKKKRSPLTFGTADGTVATFPESDMVDLTTISEQNGKSYEIGEVQTLDAEFSPYYTMTNEDLRKWKHLEGLPITSCYDVQPTILLGAAHPDLVTPMRRIDGRNRNEPIAVETPLGWALFGRVPETEELPRQNAMLVMSAEEQDEDLHKIVKQYFSTEAFGVKSTAVKPRSREDQRALDIMANSARRVGNQWEIALPWKDDNITLPESRNQAEIRLKSTEKRMDKDPAFSKLYCDKIKEYLDKGFIRKLTSEEAEHNSPRKWYLPHFGVWNPNKPGKYRFVFDAAACSNGVSLNNKLLKGPDFVPPLPAVLFRFRQRKVGYTADITDMFHKVLIRKEDQDSQRFLWRGTDRNSPPDEFVMQVMVFGAASSPSCAQFVKNRNALEVGGDRKEAINDIIFNHYVDDFLKSSDTTKEALQRFEEVLDIHDQGGFRICKWLSNSREFNQRIPEELRATGVKAMSMDTGDMTERVLGLHWDPIQDEFTFKTVFHKVDSDVAQGKRRPTKREALALVMSLYDPLGFLAHFTVKAKILLQQTWRSEIGWDDEIPTSMEQKWYQWISELKQIPTFRIPRCYSLNFTQAEANIQLHVFVDGSEQAFSTIAYFRIEFNGHVEVVLVAAKARVAPLKPLTIPRMELQAAVMGSRLATCIETEHEVRVHQKVFWSDSKTVLWWLKADGRKFQQFVSGRIGEIQEVTEVSQWRWIPTSENVADEATRDNRPCDWSSTSRWVNGPSFLKQSEDAWPKQKTKEALACEVSESDLEMKREKINLLRNHNQLIDVHRYSSWIKLLRTTALVLKAVNCFKSKTLKRACCLTTEDLQRAEEWLILQSQQQSFDTDIKTIKTGKTLGKNSSLYKLCPFIDGQGILRMQSRLPEDAELYGMDRNPIIMDAKNPYTVLMIRYHHEKAGHHGMEKVTNDLKQKFYIPRIRVAIRRAWSECQVCKNRRVKPAEPLMGQIPIARLQTFVPPFTVTGLDYFGPIEVTVGYRRKEKRYGALFTCMSTRAIHVEIASSLSTDSCLMAIRRFISRRGCPREIFSDNGKNFIGANNELRKIQEIDQARIEAEMGSRGIQWHFIPPLAPHMGGTWERMVKSFKVAIGATLKEQAPKEEVLATLMAEAEYIVNGRPLTHVPVDPDDPIALTPNHFLLGRAGDVTLWRKRDDSEKCLNRRWEFTQQLADRFWGRFVKEFHPTLVKREKWFLPQKSIEIGDIVIIVDESLPRNHWPKGRIVATYPGRDGHVRTVEVLTPQGTYKRPAVKVCVLDVKKPDTTVEVPMEEKISLLREACRKDVTGKGSQSGRIKR